MYLKNAKSLYIINESNMQIQYFCAHWTITKTVKLQKPLSISLLNFILKKNYSNTLWKKL